MNHFFEKVKRSDAGCWEWQAGTFLPPSLPYGRFKINGVTRPAHRVVWAYVFGDIPSPLWVLHRCDNPRCVNPFHLFLGTAQDNVDDCIRKGRRISRIGIKSSKGIGEDHPNSKLTRENVIAIRAMYKFRKCGAGRIAKMYGVSKQSVQSVLSGETWAHV